MLFVNTHLLDMLSPCVVLKAQKKQSAQIEPIRRYEVSCRQVETAQKKHFPEGQMYAIRRHSKMKD